MTALVVGASGFIGQRLLGPSDRAMVRKLSLRENEVKGDLLIPDSLRMACEGVDTVFHCAGYAHAFISTDSSITWRVNFDGTRNLIQAAGESGVKKFVFLSSVKAMGEFGDVCVEEDWAKEPDTSYGKAKRAAENIIIEIGDKFNMHVVNLRLSMVYGYGGRGNMERMAKGIRAGWFPPLPETGNKRSLVHVDDVVSAARMVAERAEARSQTYIVASPDAWSGRQIYDAIRNAHLMSPTRLQVPENILRASGIFGSLMEGVFGKTLLLNTEVVNRLLGSSWYSSKKIENELGWRARVGLEDGLREMLGKEIHN